MTDTIHLPVTAHQIHKYVQRAVEAFQGFTRTTGMWGIYDREALNGMVNRGKDAILAMASHTHNAPIDVLRKAKDVTLDVESDGRVRAIGYEVTGSLSIPAQIALADMMLADNLEEAFTRFVELARQQPEPAA